MTAIPADRATPQGLAVFELDGRGGAQKATLAAAGGASQAALWVHVNFSTEAGRRWLASESEIEAIVREAILEDETRPRSLQTETGLLTILRGVNLNADASFEDMISIRIWVENGLVLTASRRPLRSVADIMQALEQGRGPETPAGVLVHIIDRLGDYIGESVERIEDSLERIETSAEQTNRMIRNSPYSTLRRQTARIRRYLAPQRDALERVSRSNGGLFSAAQVLQLREQVNRFTLILENLDLIRERALVAQEEFLGIMAYEQNIRMLLLSIVAAIFLPLSFVTGLLGMNVAGLPGTGNDHAFAIVMALMLVMAALIMAIFKARKWF